MFSIYPIKGTIGDIDGFYCDGVSANLKTNNTLDMGFIYSDTLCDVQTIFTSNKFQAAPLKHYQNYKNNFQTNFILINSKNANAMTGKSGIENINNLFNELKDIHKEIRNPIMSSTGVIGVPLPYEKILKGAIKFNLSHKNGINLSNAIMTTDKYPKNCFYKVLLKDGNSFKIGAIAKGAGMINPNLATMLCFICTDASIPKAHMEELLLLNTKTTFNAISVDGDTSTNDTVMLLSNKKSNAYNKAAFSEALRLVMDDMAMLMISDGEGAKKSIAFEVYGAKNNDEAEHIAKTLSNSLLIKTALFGEDPNWGRIASVIGASGVTCAEESLTITFGDILVYNKGEIYFNNETEKKASKVLQNDKFKIICDLGIANGNFIAYGCDLGYEYVKINADYRT
jgi:glutamate N-acetyltransferase/amino-acid N-acetyltransferase